MLVEEFTNAFDRLRICCDVVEEEEETIARYLAGLKPEITHVVCLQQYWSYNDVCRAALRWKNRLSAGLITTWDLLEKTFIKKYCPPFNTAMKLEKIRNFKQEMDETLYHAWERYNDLLFRCPQHDMNNHQKVQIFYTGLNIPTRIRLDSKGFTPLMTPARALKLIQVMADHSHNWYDGATDDIK
ncbi:reverse transcriptase domain-containing protein [Tanacetum coccineum]